MEDHHTGVLLVVLLAALVSVKASDLCPFDDWTYHDPTGTCVSLRNITKNMVEAHDICRNFNGGFGRKSIGYMVRIYDKNTDDFVKDLLRANSAKMAWIGAKYDTSRKLYRWTYSSQALENYVGWIPGQILGHTDNIYVIITELGWKLQHENALAVPVCQVDAVVPLPSIRCSPAKIGQRSPNIECTLSVPTDLVTSFEMRFQKAGKVEAACIGQGCPMHQRYEVSISDADNSSWASVLNIKDVQRQDEGMWSCSVRFGGGQEVSSNICDMKVYAVASTIDCEVNYFQDAMKVTCTTTRMYPAATCHWDITSDLTFQEWPTAETTGSIEEYQSGFNYYRAVCSTTVTRPVAGEYLFNLTVHPVVLGLDLTQSITVQSESFNVTLETPKDPVLYDSSGVKFPSQLQVTYNQIVTINCQIEGGRPEVYSTLIKCYGQLRNTSPAPFATIDIIISSDSHGHNCSCYGKHLTGLTNETTLTFLVPSPPRVTSFSVNNIHTHALVDNKVTIFLKCQATGYPQYRLSLLYYQDGDRILTTTVSSSQVSYNMTATCQTMGKYTCLAENNARQMDVKDLRLSVKCIPNYCHHIEPHPRHAAAIDSNATIKMCILAVYPAPTSFWLYKVVGTEETEIAKSWFKATFTYTDELRGLGEVTLTIFSVNNKDFGVYKLYSMIERDNKKQRWYFKFELLARGPPSCPRYMKVSSTFSDSITLSWIPGFDGGLQQSFTILRYDSCLTTEPQNVSVVSEPVGNFEAAMSYNVTGLSPGSAYSFGLITENEEGVTNCTHQVKVSLTGTTEINPITTTVPTRLPTTVQTTRSYSVDQNTTQQATTSIYATTESTRPPIRNDFDCYLTHMNVFVPVDLAPNSVLKLKNTSCQLQNNGTHYVTSFSYDQCGTTQEYYYTNLILVKNEITVHVELAKSDPIQFSPDYTIPLICVVRVNNSAVDSAFQAVDRDQYSPQYGQSPDFEMKEFGSASYQDEITQYPVKVPINREIFFELSLTHVRGDNSGIQVDRCEATPTPDANSTVRFSLISDGCSASPAVKVLPRPELNRYRFSVQTFHFAAPANQNNLVYVHCYLNVCQATNCVSTCPVSKRRRRSLRHRVSAFTLSSGSHIISPE